MSNPEAEVIHNAQGQEFMPDERSKLRQHIWRQAQRNKGRQQRIYWLDDAIAKELDSRVAGMGGDKQDAINAALKSLLVKNKHISKVEASVVEHTTTPEQQPKPTLVVTACKKNRPCLQTESFSAQIN